MADNFYARYSANTPSTVVSSLNGQSGALTLLAGTNIAITPGSGTLTISSTAGTGTVTSVDMTVPSILSVTGNPITTAGTLALTLTNQAANTVFAGPTTGGATAPTFRTLVASDVPLLPYISTTLGTANGLSVSTNTLSLALSSTSTTGSLSSTDWNTFNNKQAAGNYITALTGDVTATGPGSVTATIQSNVVTNAKLAQMPALTIKGNNTGGTANALDLTTAQVNAILPVFTSALNGLVPLSGGGTLNFLRADGTFAAPPGATSGTVTSVALSLPVSVFAVTGSPVTSSGTLAGSFNTQTANTIFAGPTTGGAAVPAFRALVSADIPNNAANTTGTASNVTATSNSTLTTLTALSLPASQLSGTVAVANGGTSNTTAAGARTSTGLNIDQRSTFSNANYTVLSTDRYVAQTGTMSAPRTVTLPAANSVNAGQKLVIADESGTVSTTNTITITAGAGDTINGSASKTIRSAYGEADLTSNGSNLWFRPVTGIGSGGTGLSTTPTDGQLLIGQTSTNSYVQATLTAGNGMTVTNGGGSITVAGKGFVLNDQTANYTLVAGDFGKIVRDTGSTAITFSVTAAATLGSGWWCYIKNNSTGVANAGQLTIDPNAAETVDGQATLVTYPGDLRIIECDGASFTTQLIQGGYVQYTAAGASTFTAPTKLTSVRVELWGGGGAGGSGRRGAAGTARSSGGAGGGGAYVERTYPGAVIGSSVTVTVASAATAGAAVTADNTSGAPGADAGNSTFGTFLTAYGGGGGSAGTAANVQGGGGGGSLTAAVNNTGGGPLAAAGGANFGGATGGTAVGSESGYGGAAGGGTTAGVSGKAGGCSALGGAGGGSGGGITTGDTASAGGAGGSGPGALSAGGGAGGATSTAGTAGTAGPGNLGPGTGGGGGGGSITTTGGTGGAGGIACGGGGGGASLNGNNSGAGGAGGSGLCRIYYE